MAKPSSSAHTAPPAAEGEDHTCSQTRELARFEASIDSHEERLGEVELAVAKAEGTIGNLKDAIGRHSEVHAAISLRQDRLAEKLENIAKDSATFSVTCAGLQRSVDALAASTAQQALDSHAFMQAITDQVTKSHAAMISSFSTTTTAMIKESSQAFGQVVKDTLNDPSLRQVRTEQQGRKDNAENIRTQETVKILKMVVFGLVGIILTAVVTAMVTGVLKSDSKDKDKADHAAATK